jgi:hypothetical protein
MDLPSWEPPVAAETKIRPNLSALIDQPPNGLQDHRIDNESKCEENIAQDFQPVLLVSEKRFTKILFERTYDLPQAKGLLLE